MSEGESTGAAAAPAQQKTAAESGESRGNGRAKRERRSGGGQRTSAPTYFTSSTSSSSTPPRRSSRGKGRGRGRGRGRGGRYEGPVISMHPPDRTLVFVYSVDGRYLDPDTAAAWFSEHCGPVRTAFFRDYQAHGFLKFSSEEARDAAVALGTADMDGRKVGVTLVDKVTPGKDIRTEVKNNSIVLKNLAYALPVEQLTAHLNTMPAVPETVVYHNDDNGAFTGIAFLTYKSMDDAEVAYRALNGMRIDGRHVFIEYKRRSKLEMMLADEEAQKLQAQLQAFKEGEEETLTLEKSFPRGLRKVVHVLCSRMDLFHDSFGEGSDRVLIVSKVPIVRELMEKTWDRSSRGRAAPSRGRGRGRDERSSRGRDAARNSRGRGRGGRLLDGGSRAKAPTIQPVRQPRAPDGTIGFAKEYQVKRRPELAPIFAAEEEAARVREEERARLAAEKAALLAAAEAAAAEAVAAARAVAEAEANAAALAEAAAAALAAAQAATAEPSTEGEAAPAPAEGSPQP